MKYFKLIFITILLGLCSLSFEAIAQAEIIIGNEVVFYDQDKVPHSSVSSKTTLNPSGNIVKTANFQLPKGHVLIPAKGKNFVAAKITSVDIDGNEVTMYDINIGIDKTGKFKITYHSNGAGSVFPAKYKIWFQ
jgi:hypothetical protein